MAHPLPTNTYKNSSLGTQATQAPLRDELHSIRTVPDTTVPHNISSYTNVPIPESSHRQAHTEQSLQQPLNQLENTSRRLKSFFIVALIALVGWVIVQTLFSLSPFGKSQPFTVLAIEFVWWLTLLAILALLFKGVLSRLTFSTLNLKLVKQQLDIAHEEIVQKNALLEQSIKDVWAARRRFTLPANVIAPGHYQIQDLFGGYRDVRVQNENGTHRLVCDCYVYKKDNICTHTIAASSLHLRIYNILHRQERKTSNRNQAMQGA